LQYFDGTWDVPPTSPPIVRCWPCLADCFLVHSGELSV
jgi:hypothetical protein